MVRKTLWILLIVAITLGFNACEDDSTNEPVDPDVNAPTNIRASSADEALILDWDPSTSEAQDNFGGYKISILNETTNEETFENAPRGDGYTITGLQNGTRYLISVWAVTTEGKQSATPVKIEWAPAIRRTVNQDNAPIRVYATTSSQYNSAVDLFNASGICEVIPQLSQDFTDRGDLYVYAPNTTSNFLVIKSPSTASNSDLVTQFSTVTYNNVDALDESVTTTAPATSTYTKQDVTITNGDVSHGLIVYGRLSRNTDYYYFRLLVIRGNDGKLVQGSGADRYLEFDVSYQHIRNVPFAKH